MLTLVADLLLTDAFLIKGRIENKYARLSKVLEESRRRFLPVREATLVDLRSRDRIATPRVFVNTDEIVFAHELVDASGDLYQRTLATERAGLEIRAFYAGSVCLELAGKVRPGAYDPMDGSKRFFVMENPEIRGLRLEDDEDLAILRNLPYAIVNRERLSYIYDFQS